MGMFLLIAFCGGIFLIAFGIAEKCGAFNSAPPEASELDMRFAAYSALEQVEEEFDLSADERRAAMARIKAALRKGRDTFKLIIGGESVEFQFSRE